MGGYKEYKQFDILKRKPIILGYICGITIITIIVFCLFVASTHKNKKEDDINYKETSNIDYNVYLQENEFFENEYLEKDNQYIASLIDHIETQFDYKLETSNKNKDYKCKYRIELVTNVLEKSTHNLLYTTQEDLVKDKEMNFNGESNLEIDEKLNINYNKYNDLINKFVDVYDLDNSESTIKVNMYVEILDSELKRDSTSPVMSLEIPLTTKTVAIDIVSNEINENTGNISQNIKQQRELYIAIVLLIIDIILAIKLIVFIYDTQNEKTVYKMKLRKILTNYGSYIQKINKDFDFEGYQAIELNSFENLLQIRDIVQEPILMLQREKEAHFMVPTQSKLLYMFELNTGNTKKRITEKTNIELNVKELVHKE